MKILNSLILFMLLQVFAYGQCKPCQPSEYPQDVGMYEIYVCHSEKGFQPMKKGQIQSQSTPKFLLLLNLLR